MEPEPPIFSPYLPPGTDFKPESSPYFPKDFDIERPPHDNYAQAPRLILITKLIFKLYRVTERIFSDFYIKNMTHNME